MDNSTYVGLPKFISFWPIFKPCAARSCQSSTAEAAPVLWVIQSCVCTCSNHIEATPHEIPPPLLVIWSLFWLQLTKHVVFRHVSLQRSALSQADWRRKTTLLSSSCLCRRPMVGFHNSALGERNLPGSPRWAIWSSFAIQVERCHLFATHRSEHINQLICQEVF